MHTTNEGILYDINKGWEPHKFLTNMSIAYFQPDDWFVAPFIFPMVPVANSTGYFYKFNKADLARDDVKRKPEMGKVQPTLFGTDKDLYSCEVDQIIIGIDQISSLDYQRGGTPGISDPRRAKVRLATEKMKLHMDRILADSFFKAGVWTNQWTGKTASLGSSDFYKFNDSNFDPISFFGARRVEMMKAGRRKPNVLALGVEAYEALKQNADILDRVKYSGSTPNPATINTNVLAQLLEIDRVVVLNSTYNSAALGEDASMNFICDSKGALLCYANPNPAVDDVSAGYIFTWDMLGNGSYIAFDQFEGEKGTHSEFIEGLMSYTPKKICDELGCYLTACV